MYPEKNDERQHDNISLRLGPIAKHDPIFLEVIDLDSTFEFDFTVDNTLTTANIENYGA